MLSIFKSHSSLLEVVKNIVFLNALKEALRFGK